MSVPFFLGQAQAGGEPTGWWDVVRHDVLPVASAYLAFLALLVISRRASSRPRRSARPSHTGSEPRGIVALTRYLAGMIVGGYVVFLVIVVVFYLLLGGESSVFVGHALAGAAWLGFGVVLPAFLLLSWLADLMNGAVGCPPDPRQRRRGGKG